MMRFSPEVLPDADTDGACTDDRPLLVPHPDAFARYPQSWYFACRSDRLPRGAKISVELCGLRLVVFRGDGGAPSAVAARCPHLGSDLAGGRVVGETIECPYHRLRFDGAGRCPQQHDLRARAFPTTERFGAVFVFLGARPPFPFPDFAGEHHLISARPFHWRLATQWHMVGANAFDARHFAAIHGRHLRNAPTIVHPARCAMRVEYTYEIEGITWVDRAIKVLSGSTVEFSVTSWCGNVLLVEAHFRRDVSYGVVIVQPRRAAQPSTDVTVIVNAPAGTAWAAPLARRLRLELKRFAIGRMLLDDFESLRRLDYVHDGLRPGDEVLAQYLRWVRVVACDASEMSD